MGKYFAICLKNIKPNQGLHLFCFSFAQNKLDFVVGFMYFGIMNHLLKLASISLPFYNLNT